LEKNSIVNDERQTSRRKGLSPIFNHQAGHIFERRFSRHQRRPGGPSEGGNPQVLNSQSGESKGFEPGQFFLRSFVVWKGLYVSQHFQCGDEPVQSLSQTGFIFGLGSADVRQPTA
jgi:hypothetical protein